MSTRFSITLTLDDFIAANMLYLRRYWVWSGLLKFYAFGAVAFFLLMLVFTALEQLLTWQFIAGLLVASLGFGLGMLVLMPMVSWVAMRLAVKRQYEQLALALPAEYEIDAHGFRAANEIGVSTLPWDRICDFVHDGRVLLLRRTRRIFFVLPKAQLSSEELTTTLAYLRAAGVKES